MLIVISTVSTLTTFFYKNIDTSNLTEDTTTQFTKFTSIFTKEINTENNKVIEAKIDDKGNSYIIFSTENQYTYNKDNNSIYKNNKKICENIEVCEFSYEYIDSIYKVKVSFKTGNIDKTGENIMVYNLKNSNL